MNCSFTFQGSLEPETLGSGCSVDYVWDDLSLPHKLFVQIDGSFCPVSPIWFILYL